MVRKDVLNKPCCFLVCFRYLVHIFQFYDLHNGPLVQRIFKIDCDRLYGHFLKHSSSIREGEGV